MNRKARIPYIFPGNKCELYLCTKYKLVAYMCAQRMRWSHGSVEGKGQAEKLSDEEQKIRTDELLILLFIII